MIKPNELRLSNYVLLNGTYVTIKSVSENRCEILQKTKRSACNYDEIEGIPLTSERLLKFGFKLVGSQTYEKTCGDDFTIKVEDDQHCGTALFLEGSGAIPIDFLHQLQNIVHALTGEELTIQEKEIGPPMMGMSY